MTHFSAHLTCRPSRPLSEKPDQLWKHTSQPISSVCQASATTRRSPMSPGRGKESARLEERWRAGGKIKVPVHAWDLGWIVQGSQERGDKRWIGQSKRWRTKEEMDENDRLFFLNDGLEPVLGCDTYKPSQDTTHYNLKPVHGLWHCGELGFVCLCVAIFPPQLENTATFGQSCQNWAGLIHFTTGELTGSISRVVWWKMESCGEGGPSFCSLVFLFPS